MTLNNNNNSWITVETFLNKNKEIKKNFKGSKKALKQLNKFRKLQNWNSLIKDSMKS